MSISIEDRLKSLEQWRDAVTQACFQTPKQEPVPGQQKIAEPPKPEQTPKNKLEEWIIFEGNIAKAKHFIADRGLWQALNEDLKAMGYRWISEGKDSRWQK